MKYDEDTEEFIKKLYDDHRGGRLPFLIPTYDWYSEPTGVVFLFLLLASTVSLGLLVRQDSAVVTAVVMAGFILLIGTFSVLAWFHTTRVLRKRIWDGIRYTWEFAVNRRAGWFSLFEPAIIFLAIGGLVTVAYVWRDSAPSFNGAMFIEMWLIVIALSFSAVTAVLRPPAILFLTASSQRALVVKRAAISAAQPLRVISFVKLPKTNIEYLLSSVAINVFRREDDEDWMRSVKRAIDIASFVVIDCHVATRSLVQEIVAVTRKNATDKVILLGDSVSRAQLVSLLPRPIQVTWRRKEIHDDIRVIRTKIRNGGSRGRGWAVFVLVIAGAMLFVMYLHYLKRGF